MKVLQNRIVLVSLDTPELGSLKNLTTGMINNCRYIFSQQSFKNKLSNRFDRYNLPQHYMQFKFLCSDNDDRIIVLMCNTEKAVDVYENLQDIVSEVIKEEYEEIYCKHHIIQSLPFFKTALKEQLPITFESDVFELVKIIDIKFQEITRDMFQKEEDKDMLLEKAVLEQKLINASSLICHFNSQISAMVKKVTELESEKQKLSCICEDLGKDFGSLELLYEESVKKNDDLKEGFRSCLNELCSLVNDPCNSRIMSYNKACTLNTCIREWLNLINTTA